MAISTITSAGIATDTLVAGDIAADAVGSSEIAADAVGLSELNDATGVTSTHHKVPAFADDAARNTAIPSPANGMIIYNTDANALQQYNGAWAAIVPPPSISSLSGFLNEDTDSTISIFGSNFNSASIVKIFDASAGGNQVGSNATTTFNSATKLTAVFGGAGVPVAGNAVYIEVDNAGVTNRFATAITVNADPAATFAGGTGTGFSSPTHLGTYSGEETEVDAETQLLLNFDRGGGTDFEDNSNIDDVGHKVTASNNAIIKASPYGDGKSAMKFDGTDDYISAPDSADWDFGNGDFTIEWWQNMSGDVSASTGIWAHWEGNQDRFQCYKNTASKVTVYSMYNSGTGYPSASGTELTSSIAVVFGAWEHYAVVCVGDGSSGGTHKMYRNGILVATEDHAVSQTGIAGAVQIGHENQAGHEWYDGYIDEFRVVKGTAVYTSNFTVPTTRLTAITKTKLLIHSNRTDEGNTTFTDSSNGASDQSTAHTITIGSVPIHSKLHGGIAPALTWPASGKKFGSAGVYFDGATDYVTIASSPVLGTADFTIDFWLNVAATQNAGESTYYIWEGRTDNAADNTISITMNDSDQLQINNFRSDKTTAMIPYHADTVSTADTWKHIAVVRESANVIKLYIGGVLKGTSANVDQGSFDNDGTSLLGIEWQVSANEFTGYINVFRISNTARWTANFTPPTTLYNGVAGAATLPTITFTGTATPAIAADEDIEFTSVDNTAKADGSRHLTDTDIGATLTNLTGGSKSNATLTGSLTSAESTTHTNMPLKIQVRKTLGNAAYANAARTVTFSSSTVTTGLAPAMPVSGTGIPASTTITTVDSATTITLSANPTGGTLTGQSLIFEDLTRITHLGGSDTLDNTDTMLTIATGAATGKTLFNARRYYGTGAARSITGFGFAPDLIWCKSRSAGYSHAVDDTVRGAGNEIKSDTTAAESLQADTITTFDNDGFSVGTSVSFNSSSNTYVAWGWKAGGAPSGALGDISSTGIGAGTITGSGDTGWSSVSIVSSVTQSVNQTSGFSITAYTGEDSNGTFPHNLGATPDFVLIKCRNEATEWTARHSSMTAGEICKLNTSDADSASSHLPSDPTSTIITVQGGNLDVNSGSKTYICYAWKAVAGVSAFGSYTGNENTNTITYANSNSFTARYIIIKDRTNAGNWLMHDVFRGMSERLSANVAGAAIDDTGTQNYYPTPTSTGFSYPSTVTDGGWNATGHVYIYMAFA